MEIAGSCTTPVHHVVPVFQNGISCVEKNHCHSARASLSPSLQIRANLSKHGQQAYSQLAHLGTRQAGHRKCRRRRPAFPGAHEGPISISRRNSKASQISAASRDPAKDFSLLDDFEQSWEGEHADRVATPPKSQYDAAAEEVVDRTWDIRDQLPFDMNQLPFDLKGFFDPSPDNLLAVVFTSILAFIILQLAWQFVVILVSVAFYSIKYAVLGLILAVIIVYTI
eukprot:TRINITY_DN18922_c0_g1_i1.p1 TRINITY_DN18922_c0_g1~~TRINITY_DN18922_c0_g1_i1.p1  ORF type:complete len:225 (-),score=9.41 TRINITY_DN18922_c0_g1_i1:514-1188(-)